MVILVKLAKWVALFLLTTQRSIIIAISLIVSTLMGVEILWRYFLQQSLYGVEEIVLIVVMWLYVLGAAMATRDRRHVKVDLMRLLIKDPQKLAVIRALTVLIALVMAGYMVYWSSALFFWGLERNPTTPVLLLPWVISQSSLFFGGILIAIYFLHELVDNIRAIIAKQDISVKEPG